MTTFAAPASLAADNQTIDLWVVTELGFTKTASVDTAKAPIVHIQPYSDDHFLIISGPTTADAYATVIQLLDISGTQPHISDAAANGQTQGAGTIVFGSPGLSISGDDKIVGNCKAIVKESKTAQAFTFTATFTDGVFSISGTTNVDWNPTKLGLTTVAVDGDEVVYYDPSGDPAFGRIIRRKISALTTARIGDTRSIGGPDWANRRWWFKDNRLWWADGTTVEGDLWQIWASFGRTALLNRWYGGVAVSPDGNVLYASESSGRTGTDSTVRVFNPQSGTEDTSRRFSVKSSGTTPSYLAISPDGLLLYSQNQQQVYAYSLPSGVADAGADLVPVWPDGSSSNFLWGHAVSHDGTKMYLNVAYTLNGTSGSFLQTYDLSDKTLLTTVEVPRNDWWGRCIASSSDGTTIYVGPQSGSTVLAFGLDGTPQPTKNVAFADLSIVNGMNVTPDGVGMYATNNRNRLVTVVAI